MAIPNTYASGVYPELYEASLQGRLNKPVSWKDVCDVQYTDAYIVNWPYMSTEFSAQTGTRGCSYSFSEFTLTNDTLTVSSIKHVPVFLDEADMAQNPMFTQTQAAERQGALLLDAIETAVLADHANWTNLGLTGGLIDAAVTDPITVSATNVDNIVRALRREVVVANGQQFADRNGLFVVWRADDMEFLEEYCQNSGFNLADRALQNGVPNGYDILGVTHYVSNSHAAAAAGVQHLFAGVKKDRKSVV